MKLVLSPDAWAEYLVWVSGDRAELERVNELIRQTMHTPIQGIGKPEAVVGHLRGWWSRRITREHRLVYRASGSGKGQSLEIAACRFHYAR